MADLTQEQMLEMARIAGLSIPDEDVEHLTIRLNALLEASEVLGQYPLDELKALPSLPHPYELPSSRREERPAPPLTVETIPLAVLSNPPLTEETGPLAVLNVPPLTEDTFPLAVLPAPPLTEDAHPLATLLEPPITAAPGPVISL